MNERIKELAKEADIPAIEGDWDYNDRNLLVKEDGEWRVAQSSEIISTMIQSERGLEKFAELIVKECAETVQDFVDHRIPASEYSERLKKYFGVEE